MLSSFLRSFLPSFLPELTRRASGTLAVGVLAAAALPAHAAGTWQTTLQGRDLDGNAATFEAYYDTALNITWLADADHAQTSGYDGDGNMSWDAAQAWVAQLDIHGTTGWRLPTMVDVGNDGCTVSSQAGGANTDCGYNIDTSLSEMAHMYYVTLGNKGYFAPGTGDPDQPGWGLNNTGPFSNVQPDWYWLGVQSATNSDSAWLYYPYNGYQAGFLKYFEASAWAVHSGDVSAPVPEPQTYALALAGLAAAFVMRRRSIT
jgi:MYXO-CTERM domain-containing protein